jgi:signal peptidase II
MESGSGQGIWMQRRLLATSIERTLEAWFPPFDAHAVAARLRATILHMSRDTLDERDTVFMQRANEATKTPSSLTGFLPWLLLPAGLIVVDQLLKVLMVAWIGPDANRHRVEVGGSFLAFEYVENRGAAFGIFGSATEALAAVSIVIASAGIYMLWREHRENPPAAVAIALIVGGAVGNVIDRVFRGYVVDFVAVGVWPRFNLADSAVTIGVLVLLWAMIRDERELRSTLNEGTPTTDG